MFTRRTRVVNGKYNVRYRPTYLYLWGMGRSSAANSSQLVRVPTRMQPTRTRIIYKKITVLYTYKFVFIKGKIKEKIHILFLNLVPLKRIIYWVWLAGMNIISLTCMMSGARCSLLQIIRIDNGNALFYGLPQNQISRLQHIQNTAARVVTLSRKSCHITPILKELHWLPVLQRIVFKLMLNSIP